jgi:hypothetical protein
MSGSAFLPGKKAPFFPGAFSRITNTARVVKTFLPFFPANVLPSLKKLSSLSSFPTVPLREVFQDWILNIEGRDPSGRKEERYLLKRSLSPNRYLKGKLSSRAIGKKATFFPAKEYNENIIKNVLDVCYTSVNSQRHEARDKHPHPADIQPRAKVSMARDGGWRVVLRGYHQQRDPRSGVCGRSAHGSQVLVPSRRRRHSDLAHRVVSMLGLYSRAEPPSCRARYRPGPQVAARMRARVSAHFCVKFDLQTKQERRYEAH